MSFGGLGNNIFNPALVGRVFLLISFPVQMTSWPEPGQLSSYLDATTAATPLALLSADKSVPYSLLDMFIGATNGSLGDISAIALILGFGSMLIRQFITWHIQF